MAVQAPNVVDLFDFLLPNTGTSRQSGSQSGSQTAVKQGLVDTSGLKFDDFTSERTSEQDQRRLIDELITRLPEAQQQQLGDLATRLGTDLDLTGDRTRGFVDDLRASTRAQSIRDFELNELSPVLNQAQQIGSLDNTTSQQLLSQAQLDLNRGVNLQDAQLALQGEEFIGQQRERDIGALLDTIGGLKGASEQRTGAISDRLISTLRDDQSRTTGEISRQAQLTNEKTTSDIQTFDNQKQRSGGLLDRIFSIF